MPVMSMLMPSRVPMAHNMACPTRHLEFRRRKRSCQSHTTSARQYLRVERPTRRADFLRCRSASSGQRAVPECRGKSRYLRNAVVDALFRSRASAVRVAVHSRVAERRTSDRTVRSGYGAIGATEDLAAGCYHPHSAYRPSAGACRRTALLYFGRITQW